MVIEPFYIKTGELKNKKPDCISYTKVFGRKLCELAEEDSSIAAVCAAMPQGTGLTDFADTFQDRFFDVGIAEEHAVTFAGALAADGIKPVVANIQHFYSVHMTRLYMMYALEECMLYLQ